MDGPAVEPGPLAGGGRETLLQQRIVDRAHQQFAVAFQGQRHAVMRHAVDEIGRAVQRIDDPSVLGASRGRLAGHFLFAQQTMPRKGPEHGPADRLLRGQVGLGHEVGRALLPDLEPANPVLDLTPANTHGFFANTEILVDHAH